MPNGDYPVCEYCICLSCEEQDICEAANCDECDLIGADPIDKCSEI